MTTMMIAVHETPERVRFSAGVRRPRMARLIRSVPRPRMPRMISLASSGLPASIASRTPASFQIASIVGRIRSWIAELFLP